jgi:hypothetical protein
MQKSKEKYVIVQVSVTKATSFQADHSSCLINTMSSTAISTVHAASASSLKFEISINLEEMDICLAYLETRTSCQTSSKLHHGTADFITDACAAALVVNWADAGMSDAGMTSNHRLLVALATTRCCRCRSCGGGYLLAAAEALHKRRLRVLCALRAADHFDIVGFLKKKEVY